MVAVIDSGAVGVDRPDPAIFNLALDAVHATPDEAIHIGDSAWTDMEGARRAASRESTSLAAVYAPTNRIGMRAIFQVQ